MDEISAKRLRRRAFQTAKAHGWLRFADDFAQWAVEQTLKGRKAKLLYLLLDYLELHHGYVGRAKQGKTSKRIPPAMTFSLSDVASKNPGTTTTLEEVIAAPPDNALLQFPEGEFSAREKSFLILKSQFQLTNKEIGFVFGISESRVSQIFTRIRERQ